MARTVTRSLHSITRDLDALRSQFDAGEPEPSSPTLRARIGFVLKRRLYRFMWWQTAQFRAVLDVMSRWIHEEITALDTAVENISETPPDTSQRERDFESRLQWLATTSSQRYRDFEVRLQQLQAMQQKLDAEGHRRETEYASLGRELTGVKQSISLEREHMEKISGGIATQREDVEKISEGISAQREHIEKISEATSGLTQRLDAETAQHDKLARKLSELGTYAHQTRTALSIQERRISIFLEQVRKHRSDFEGADPLRDMAKYETQHRYDSLYAAFEDLMRGSREEIKARQTVYVSFLQDYEIGSPSMPVLDLGCGRGEWLEVLKEHNLQASGVDNNDEMVGRCQAFGLPASKGEALSYLGSLPDSSIGAITAFHMVEHMPFDAIVSLIDQALRVLKRGGAIVLETPNPANIQVGACTFHLDPTHLKPVPSPMLRFVVEARGFCEVQVRELHPYPEVLLLPDDVNGIASRVNQLLYGPQDYAVIGRRP
jgi:ubiquinone/menaquinone biosynthesis C-methylase UbiE/predicted  nucleic acid-binding Zn-ribbon protein